MVTRILYLHPKAYKRLIRLRKQAERDGAYRVAKRLQAVVLNSEGRTSGELAHLLGSPRSRVSEWLARYKTFGVEGLLEGHRSGRPLELTSSQRKQLDDILESGPVAKQIDCPCVAPFDTARELERAREHYACHIMLVLMRASDSALTGR